MQSSCAECACHTAAHKHYFCIAAKQHMRSGDHHSLHADAPTCIEGGALVLVPPLLCQLGLLPHIHLQEGQGFG